MKLNEALAELRKSKERKFNQSVDLIVSLKGIDIRKDNINFVAGLPYKVKDKQVCGFLTGKNELVHTITKLDFPKYGKEKSLLRNLVKKYDFFIAHASLMPAVATAFGKALGPAGKMPSPQLGIVTDESPAVIKALLERISKSVKVRAKEPSVKLAVGKLSMKDSEIEENVKAVYNALVNALPTKKENVKKVMIKLTMTKPVEVEI